MIQALPFALLSNEDHVVTYEALYDSRLPVSERFTKHYYTSHLHALKDYFERTNGAEGLSPREWEKHFAQQRQKRIEKIMRWEQWESRGGLEKVNARPQKSSRMIEDNNTFKDLGVGLSIFGEHTSQNSRFENADGAEGRGTKMWKIGMSISSTLRRIHPLNANTHMQMIQCPRMALPAGKWAL